MPDFIPAAKPIIGDEERAAVDRVLRSGMLAQGPEVKAFEEEFSSHFGLGRACVAVNSGTSGLHLGLLAAGIGPGDEVIVPAFTFAATFATALISTSFTSQAIMTGFDRRNGVLRWIATTPLGRSGYLAGKILATLTTHVLQVVVLGVLGLVLGWRPEIAGLAALVPVWLVGTAAFGALGLLVAGLLRTEAVLAVANLVFVLLVAVGGVAFPTTSFPRILGGLADLLPSGALGELMRACLAGGPFSPGSAVVLLLWAAAGVAAVVRWFRWTDA